MLAAFVDADSNGKAGKQLFVKRRNGMGKLDDGEIFFEGSQFAYKGTRCIINLTAAVEDDLRLGADGIDVIHGQSIFEHVLPDDLPPVFVMVVVEWRSRNIDHEVRVLTDQLIHGTDPVERVIANVPDVFADGEGDLFPFERDDGPLEPGFEIAVFVEDVVV